MDCIVCGSKMNCVDDVNDISTRIDWFKCPLCNTNAEIIYSNTIIPCVKSIKFSAPEH